MLRRFLIKLLIFSTPFLLLTAGFFRYDPFKVIYHYDDYSENMLVIPNRDFVSTEIYKQNKEQQGYDSFIFGSSRTIGFRTGDWKKYIGGNARPFLFDASAETIFGIHSKVKYLDAQGSPMKNVILLVCGDATFTNEGDNEGHLLKKHPSVANTSWPRFYIEFFKSYFDVKFIASFYLYKMTGQYRPFMDGYIEPRSIKYDPITNDVTILDQERELAEDPEKFYQKRASIFYDRSKHKGVPIPVIKESQAKMLREIKAVFDKKQTSYKVVISPLYNQIPMHQDDVDLLKKIFDPGSVHDFSGVNQFTESIENYYEASHFRPIVGDSIMSEIYKVRKSD